MISGCEAGILIKRFRLFLQSIIVSKLFIYAHDLKDFFYNYFLFFLAGERKAGVTDV